METSVSKLTTFITGEEGPRDLNDINPDLLQEPNGITELFQNKYVSDKINFLHNRMMFSYIIISTKLGFCQSYVW